MGKKRTSRKFDSFLSLLRSSPIRLLAFLAVLSLFLFTPGSGYYETLQLSFREPEVRATDLEIEFSSYPRLTGKQVAPNLSAEAVIAIDQESAVPLLSINERIAWRPASLTKLMTALVALDYYQLDTELLVKRLAPSRDEADMGLAVGDNLSVRSLLYGLLIPSGNDAAYTLADNYPGGIDGFVGAMNQKASDLHMEETLFVNPSGLDSPGHLSTAYDLSLLAREALKNEFISKVVAIKATRVADSTNQKSYFLRNVNQLLGVVAGVDGVKTGFTDLAGQCLITSVSRDGRRIIVVLLGSSDRFSESTQVIEWVYRNYTWEEFLNDE